MSNVERINMIVSLTKELASSIEAFDKAKTKKDGGYIYGGVHVKYNDCPASIHRKITLIREQLMVLAKEVKP